jgi:pSer/pThr/pTyr-binding forkhead associated (FHA) protein/NADPH-dependent 2,4-dienoyl-CoA reductase/sulfur reductase-like enzyme
MSRFCKDDRVKSYAIIGDGAAGTTAAFYVRRHDPNGRISIFADESNPAYYRSALTNYLMGELRAEQLFAVPPNFYSEFKVERTLARVTGIDTDKDVLALSTGERRSYDELMIATGSRARPPDFPGAEMPGVMTMRTMQDARFIMDFIQSGNLKKAVVSGGGILGLELVAGLRARGVEVSYIVRGNRFMPTLLDRIASDLVVTRCRHFGVDVRMGEEVAQAYPDQRGNFYAARLKNSNDGVEGQLLAVAIGITPNVEVAEGSGIKVERGVVVDDRMRTNVPNVYAGGDVAQITDPRTNKQLLLGLWEPARHHGRTAGINMSGGSEVWRLPVPYNATRLYDLDLAAIGKSLEDPGDEVISDFPERGRMISYRKLIFRENRLIGALLLGERREKVRRRGSQYRKLIDSEADVSSVKELLLDPLFDLSAWMESLRTAPSGPSRVAERPRADVSRIMGRPSEADLQAAAARSQEARSPQATQVRSLSTLMQTSARDDQAAAPRATAASDKPDAGIPTLKLQGGEVVSIERERFTIGRLDDNDLTIEDVLISGHHAELQRRNGDILIADAGSTNGTFVNDVAVSAAPWTLQHGDIITIGANRLRFYKQVAAPRPETGPAGLPAEPLAPLGADPDSPASISWGSESVALSEPVMKLGRDPHEAQIALSDPAVSWLHAEISRHGDTFYLRDLGSRNGTFVNGELLSVPRPLHDGDRIHLGNTDLDFTGPSGTQPFETPESKAGQATRVALVCTAGPLLGVPFALADDRMTVGRNPSASISLDDLTVSRAHAEISRDGDDWIVKDVGSSNGTFVDGRRVEARKKEPLREGTEIRFGAVEMAVKTVTIDQDAEGTAPRAVPVSEEVAAGATRIIDSPLMSTPEAAETETSEPATSELETSQLETSESGPREPADEPAAVENQTTPAPTKMTVVKGPAEGRSVPLTDLPLVLGRESAEGILGLDDRFISRAHVRIDRAENGAIQVTDLGSTNGSWINDEQMDARSPHIVAPGDRLRMGPASVVEFES